MISVSHLSKIYKNDSVETMALDDVSFEIKKGEFVAIMGPSGSGKSTLMHILGALDSPTSGDYVLDGQSVAKLSDDSLAQIRNKKIGFIFQAFNLLARTSALKNVMLPMVYAGVDKQARETRAKQALNDVGLGDRMDHTPAKLSGGQQQRVAIARSLAMQPEVMLYDEPTSQLDPRLVDEVFNVMRELDNDGMTQIVVTHSEQFARDTASRVLMFEDGGVQWRSDQLGKGWRP